MCRLGRRFNLLGIDWSHYVLRLVCVPLCGDGLYPVILALLFTGPFSGFYLSRVFSDSRPFFPTCILIKDKGASEKNSLCVLNCVLFGNLGEFDSYQTAQQKGDRGL